MYVHISVYWCCSCVRHTDHYSLCTVEINFLSVWKWQVRVFLFRYCEWKDAALNVPQIKTSNIRHGLVPKVETIQFQSFFLRLWDKISYPSSVPGKILAVRLANKGPRNKCTLCYTTASCIRTAIHMSRASKLAWPLYKAMLTVQFSPRLTGTQIYNSNRHDNQVIIRNNTYSLSTAGISEAILDDGSTTIRRLKKWHVFVKAGSLLTAWEVRARDSIMNRPQK